MIKLFSALDIFFFPYPTYAAAGCRVISDGNGYTTIKTPVRNHDGQAKIEVTENFLVRMSAHAT